MNKIAVIGGGASGIMAALSASLKGAEVTLLEKNERVGKKILSTGNGRCNFTNINASPDDYNSDFTQYALSVFSATDAISFFEKLGMLAKIEAEGRVYPASGQASAVLDVLRFELERRNINIITQFDVDEVIKQDNSFKIVSQDKKCIYSDRVIFSTGGMAAPKSGSDGAGYRMLKSFGHSVTPLVPSLVQIKTDKGIHGVRQYGRITIKNISEEGEIQFAKDAVSGIPVFAVSKYAKKGDSIYIDFFPRMSRDELVSFLKNKPSQTMETFLIGVLNKNLGQMLIKDCNIMPLSRKSADLTDAQIGKIADFLKGWRFTVTGTMPWENAQVTSGGICLDEVCPKTFESKIVSGVYITGELLDIDGACGGYNLQWAWSSGFIAGREAAGV